jgi:SAM-dependent methyltransferase
LFSGPVEDIDLPDKFFDAITLWDVIEHLDDPVSIIKGLKPKLKKGGVLLVSTPNAGALIARVMGKRWAFMHPPEHVLFFEKKHISRMMNSCGLEMMNWVTFGKSINIAFLVYKFGRVFPEITPKWVVRYLSTSRLGRPTVYIPTGDIQYASARLNVSPNET